jgi:hypothetical protein
LRIFDKKGKFGTSRILQIMSEISAAVMATAK